MPTVITAAVRFDDGEAVISPVSGGFKLRDQAGNEVEVTMRAVLRCLNIAENEGMLPSLPDSFWQATLKYRKH